MSSDEQVYAEHDARASADPWHHVHPLDGEAEQRRRDGYDEYRAMQTRLGHSAVPYYRWHDGSVDPLGLTDVQAQAYGLPRKSCRHPEQRRQPWLPRSWFRW